MGNYSKISRLFFLHTPYSQGHQDQSWNVLICPELTEDLALSIPFLFNNSMHLECCLSRMRHSTSERFWRPAKMRISIVHSTINSHVTWIILESRGSSVIRTGLLGKKSAFSRRNDAFARKCESAKAKCPLSHRSRHFLLASERTKVKRPSQAPHRCYGT
jgi:hypothetical protein